MNDIRDVYRQPRFKWPCLKIGDVVRVLPGHIEGGFNCSRYDRKNRFCRRCVRAFNEISERYCIRKCPIRRKV